MKSSFRPSCLIFQQLTGSWSCWMCFCDSPPTSRGDEHEGIEPSAHLAERASDQIIWCIFRVGFETKALGHGHTHTHTKLVPASKNLGFFSMGRYISGLPHSHNLSTNSAHTTATREYSEKNGLCIFDISQSSCRRIPWGMYSWLHPY